MTRFAVLYTFFEGTATRALRRLRRLRTLNPDVAFFPVVGTRQYFYVPMIVDEFMFGSIRKVPLVGRVSHEINWLASSASVVFRLSEALNKKVVTFMGDSRLAALRGKMNGEGLQTVYIDFTPIYLWNVDHMLVEWFNNVGKLHDFDHLIYHEFDIYTTRPLSKVYEQYAKSYDACFIDYEEATPDWHFYNFPLGCRWATKRWLRRRNLPEKLYRSNFAGPLVSRRCLERLAELGIDFSGAPYCKVEMRLPTVLTGLGFNVGRLDFPFVRYRPVWSVEEINANAEAGIFHPVKQLVSTEREV